MDSNFFIHYPVWNLDIFGGGFFIILISVVHVYVAHFAVGGGLFLVLTEMKGYREESPEILEYTRKHTWFFLLLTMVFGAITGVGIWFVISILNPAATSVLIHSFAFGWATEWIFFIGEIVALFIYAYYFGKMNPRDHLKAGWAYFVFGILSLFVVNGMITFMLTPGKWPATFNFWDGFFNPGFFPSFFFRSFIAFMLAGLFGYITSLRIEHGDVRNSMIRSCSLWIVVSIMLLIPAAFWYKNALEEPQKAILFGASPEIIPFLNLFFLLIPVLFTLGIVMAFRVPLRAKRVIAYGMLILGIVFMGSFEWIREAVRRPFIIKDYMYSTSILKKDIEAVKKTGVLKASRWNAPYQVDKERYAEVGKVLFRQLCLPCHSIGGPVNDILPLTEKYSIIGAETMLDGLGKISPYMQPFSGNQEEKKALAFFISKILHGKSETTLPPYPEEKQPETGKFNPESDAYVLLSWSEFGMNFRFRSRLFSITPTAPAIQAILIKRGESPERILDGVTLKYRLEDGTTPTEGNLTIDENLEIYRSREIPVSPYRKNGTFHPYPIVTVSAENSETGKILASIKTVVPVSTEMNCQTCHGGKSPIQQKDGLSDETAKDILSVHDRLNHTQLLKNALGGKPADCRTCHAGVFGAESKNMSLSAAIHGFHANCLTGRDGDACGVCHPGSSEGYTKGFRGIHRKIELDCTNCHGKMEDFALGLLIQEKQAGKRNPGKWMKHLFPRTVDFVKEIPPRLPWVNQPDCLNCHVDFGEPETDEADLGSRTSSAYDLFRNRGGDAGIPCAACHGSPHAIFPADNAFGTDLDNLGPITYQGMPYPMGANKNCRVCHTIDMEEEIHHPNSLRMFRNVR